MTQEKNYKKIIPTARIVAYFRTFSDVPFSKEIFEEIEKKQNASLDVGYIPNSRAVLFEARHKIVDHLITKLGITRILETSSGYSPRGLDMTRNPNIEYIETDLPAIIKEKENIARKILADVHARRPNLYFKEVNVFNLRQLEDAVRYFTRGPIAIVAEGLLRYLNHKEKVQMTQNIKKLLIEREGVWITPDIEFRKNLAKNPSYRKSTKIISKETGTDIEQNMFGDVSEAKVFFENLGLEIEVHQLTEVKDRLTSPIHLNLAPGEVLKRLNALRAFVMKPE